MRSKLIALCLALAAVHGTAFAAGEGNPQAGKVKSATCLGCHGVEGYRNAYPSYHVPKLAGQNEQYLISALQAYKTGKRSFKTMQAQASALSEQDIKDIAAYFAQLK